MNIGRNRMESPGIGGGHRAAVRSLLAAVLAIAIGGCAGKQPQPAQSTSETTAQDTRQPSGTRQTAQPAGTGPASASASSQASVSQTASESTGPAQPQAPTEQAQDRATPHTAESRKPQPASAEQIAKWGVPSHTPLQLLACRDGFDDSLVQCLAITPDGKHFAVGGERLTLWPLTATEPQHDFLTEAVGQIKRPIRSLAVSPDGKWLACGEQEGMLRIWNLANRQAVAAIQAHDGRLTQIAFAPDSQQIATTSYSGEVRLWSADQGSRVGSLQVDTQELYRLVYVADNLLAVAGRQLTIWNTQTGERQATLLPGDVYESALASSLDRNWLAFGDRDPLVNLWEVQASKFGKTLRGHSGPVRLIDFSHDGELLATYADDSVIRIWDLNSGQTVQAIDAYGARTTDLHWSPQQRLLLVASENGRIRVWGTPEAGQAAGFELPRQQVVETVTEDRQPADLAQVRRALDLRVFPQLPGALPQWSQPTSLRYTAPVPVSEAIQFNRYYLGQSGWKETTAADNPREGYVEFVKDGFHLHAGFQGGDPTQVSLDLSGNFDPRWLPRYPDSKDVYSDFASVIYRTDADLTDLEVFLLKQFHAMGWIPYSRLDASSREEPEVRDMDFLQNGIEASVFVRRPAGEPNTFSVQYSCQVLGQALPVPADAGWVEIAVSTSPKLVAISGMKFEQLVAFYDDRMAQQGWEARQAGRYIKDGKAWLPFVQGQQDVVIRLEAQPDGTRVLAGDNVENASWQLAKPEQVDPELQRVGIEVADFPLPDDAHDVKFDRDRKQLAFECGQTVRQATDTYVEKLVALGWKTKGTGVKSDDFVLQSFEKEQGELDFRARATPSGGSAVSLDGSGLLWTKPLPTDRQAISFGTWLRRNGYPGSLERLDEFAEQMRQRAAPAAGNATP